MLPEDPIALAPTTEEWALEFGTLTADPWLAHKTNRRRRMFDQRLYLSYVAPGLAEMSPGTVIDIGPGPGELLEIARNMGHHAIGIDASDGKAGMGDECLAAYRLIWERQELEVICPDGGALDVFDGYASIPAAAGSCALINCRGSIEQVFAEFMRGRPFSEHHNESLMTWNIDDRQLRLALDNFFQWAAGMLRPNGILAIRCAGSRNEMEFDSLLQDRANHQGRLLHWGKYTSRLTHVWNKR